jgi:hypothetical protein
VQAHARSPFATEGPPQPLGARDASTRKLAGSRVSPCASNTADVRRPIRWKAHGAPGGVPEGTHRRRLRLVR